MRAAVVCVDLYTPMMSIVICHARWKLQLTATFTSQDGGAQRTSQLGQHVLPQQRGAGSACDPTATEGSSASLVDRGGGELEQQLLEISHVVSPFYAGITR